ncbi:MAG: hypothetical protein FD121_481 [Gallionellaceae bacterium]|nr:MAG: hypothetical protein FD121_481 [Gallionellaceae bacterium]
MLLHTKQAEDVHESYCINSIQRHIDLVELVRRYVHGESDAPSNWPFTCHSDCWFAKWLHGKAGSQVTEISSIDKVCASCEEFNEEVAQAMLLVKMGNRVAAKEKIQPGARFYSASERYQDELVGVHLQYL